MLGMQGIAYFSITKHKPKIRKGRERRLAAYA